MQNVLPENDFLVSCAHWGVKHRDFCENKIKSTPQKELLYSIKVNIWIFVHTWEKGFSSLTCSLKHEFVNKCHRIIDTCPKNINKTQKMLLRCFLVHKITTMTLRNSKMAYFLVVWWVHSTVNEWILVAYTSTTGIPSYLIKYTMAKK